MRSLFSPTHGQIAGLSLSPWSGPVTNAPVPAAAISVEDAELLARMQARGSTVTIRIQMSAQTLPDATSFNTVAEIRGSQVNGPNHLGLLSTARTQHEDGPNHLGSVWIAVPERGRLVLRAHRQLGRRTGRDGRRRPGAKKRLFIYGNAFPCVFPPI